MATKPKLRPRKIQAPAKPIAPIAPVVPINQFKPNVGSRYRGGRDDNKLKSPGPAQFDLVRNPNFDAAMAQQDYFNNLSRLVAERNARGAEYNLMPIGNTGATGGSAYNQTPPIATVGTALPPEFFNLTPAYDVSKLISDYQAQKDAPRLMPIGQFSPEQMQNLSPERRMALEQRMGVQQNPSVSQMQDYNRMLQQGIQNSNTMNQVAMNNFANMQPGMTNQNTPTPNSANTYSTMKPYVASTDQGMQQFKMQQQAKSSQFAQGIPKFSF